MSGLADCGQSIAPFGARGEHIPRHRSAVVREENTFPAIVLHSSASGAAPDCHIGRIASGAASDCFYRPHRCWRARCPDGHGEHVLISPIGLLATDAEADADDDDASAADADVDGVSVQALVELVDDYDVSAQPGSIVFARGVRGSLIRRQQR